MKRRILLVDDEVAVLLTLKAVLEISGFDVDTATSAREGRARIRHREYEMVITDMRMEEENAGMDVIAAAKEAPYHPAIALLTAFPVDDASLGDMGADKMLVKPMHTRVLLQQLEGLFALREKDLAAESKKGSTATAKPVTSKPVKAAAKTTTAKAKKSPVKAVAKKSVAKKSAAKKSAVKKAVAKKAAGRKG